MSDPSTTEQGENMSHTLSPSEKESLMRVLGRETSVTVLLYGEGKNQTLSFYADGTRLEARIAYPEGRR